MNDQVERNIVYFNSLFIFITKRRAGTWGYKLLSIIIIGDSINMHEKFKQVNILEKNRQQLLL